MKVLITGGGGFIGRNIFKYLTNKYQITVKSHSDLDLLNFKRVENFLKEKNFDVIINAATYDAIPAFSNKQKSKILEYNLKMFFSIVRNEKYYKRLIYFGSGAEFSRNHWKIKMQENFFDTYMPEDQYGFSKYIMTKYTRQTNRIVNLRLFNVFGEDDDWRYRPIPNFCAQAILNKKIIIKENKIFDFLYINDLVKIVELFLGKKIKYKDYNVCSGKSYSFEEIAYIIKEIANENIKIEAKNKTDIVYSGDNSRLLSEFPEIKFTPIETAIKNVYTYFLNNKNVLKEELFVV